MAIDPERLLRANPCRTFIPIIPAAMGARTNGAPCAMGSPRQPAVEETGAVPVPDQNAVLFVRQMSAVPFGLGLQTVRWRARAIERVAVILTAGMHSQASDCGMV